MSFAAHQSLCCPLDQLPLQLSGGSLRCEFGHSFDLARQGYVNLLSASDKRSRDPGDSKDMVVARNTFLAAGHYRPVAEKLAQLTETLLQPGSLLVDAGCGEGYYLQQLVEHLAIRRQPMPAMVGYDISKWAMQVAARRFPASWLVASNRHIPLLDKSVDLLWSVFGFPVYPSFARVVKPGGYLILLNGGPGHLLELREIIYPYLKPVPAEVVPPSLAADFSLLDTIALTFRTAPLDAGSVTRLLAMTPHLFRASAAGKAQLSALTSLAVTVEVELQLWQKN